MDDAEASRAGAAGSQGPAGPAADPASDPSAGWMRALRDGDEGAFDRLFERWAGPLLHMLERMLSDGALAEELVQETFLRVYRARGRYEPRARFSTWLFRIGTRLALNELRRASRSRPHEALDGTGALAGEPGVHEPADPRRDPEAELDESRRVRAVGDALAALPERQRAALWLVAVEGLAYAEVAEVLETSEGSIKSLVHRARSGIARERAATGGDGRGPGGRG